MQFHRKLFYTISPKMRFYSRRLYYLPLDTWNTIVGKRHKYEPPKGLIYIGSGNFIKQGIHQLDLLKNLIKLNQEEAVLDIGSGIGRTAVALTEFLSNKGTYEGFDVVEKGVNWCNKRVKKDFPNFNFIYVPLNNDLYNSNKKDAKSFRFPFEDNSFDKVFLFSVFTHMAVDEISHYLCEIERVMKPEGLCLATFFVFNDFVETKIENSKGFSFPIVKAGYRLMSESVKSANIAVKDTLLEQLISKSKLEKINYIEGYWKDTIQKQDKNYFQDIIILKAK